MKDSLGTSDTRVLIHESKSRCEAGAINARLETALALWTRFITLDFSSFAGIASFTQGSHRAEIKKPEEYLGLYVNKATPVIKGLTKREESDNDRT